MQRCCKLQGTFATDSKMQVLEYSLMYSPPSDNHSKWWLWVSSDDYVTTPLKPTPKIPRLVFTKQTLQAES